jgi:glyoxylase-like metal-dependent hydrolase (beta-lactamase superfamily II)
MSGIIKLTFNPFQENTFIVYNKENRCWIIDPGNSNGSENDILNKTLEDNGLEPVAVVLTHAHIDHIMGCRYAYDTWGLQPLIHRREMIIYEHAAQAAAMWGIPYNEGPEPGGYIEDGKSMSLGELQFDVLFTPGHSPGEICLYNRADKYCIAGDVLFYGSIGRTDLPGGDYDTLINSIKTELMVLDDDVVVYSGHGPDTSIGQERATNPFLR